MKRSYFRMKASQFLNLSPYTSSTLGVFRAAAFDGFARDAVVDLAEVQKSLVARRQLAGYELKERFYEIGSHEGLNELDALLRNQRGPS